MGPTIDTGKVLARSFSALVSRPGPLLGSLVIVYVPFALLLLLSTGSQEALLPSGVLVWGTLSNFFLAPLAAAAIIRGVFLQLCGEAAGFEDCWRGLGSLWLRLIGTRILVLVGAGLAAIFFLIPGLIVRTGQFVALPALVVERGGVNNALSRSWSLTKGHRLRIFFLYLGLGVIGWVLSFSAGLLLVAWGATEGWRTSATILLQGLGIALEAVVAGVVYFELRKIREGFGLDDLASVFD